MKLFLDSSAFIARALSGDEYHDVALETFSALSEGRLPYRLFYTSNFVIDETLTFVLYDAGPRLAVEVLDAFRKSSLFRVLHVSEADEVVADDAFRRFASSRVSYTDCATKALMEREGINAAFSFDRDIEVLGFARIP